MKFVFDVCISKRVFRALQELEEDGRHQYCYLDSIVDTSTDDDVWLPRLLQEKPCVLITADPAMRKGLVERKAWIAAGITTFFLGDAWASAQIYTQASRLFGAWMKIVLEAKKAGDGCAFKVTRKGEVLQQEGPH